MNPTRHATLTLFGYGRWGPLLKSVLIPATLWVLFLVFHFALVSGPPSENRCDGTTFSNRLESTVIAIPGTDTHHLRCARCCGYIRTHTPGTIAAQTLFSIPADTEPTDTETSIAKWVKPIFFVLSCISRTSRQPTAVRCVSVPLYLSHRSMLC